MKFFRLNPSNSVSGQRTRKPVVKKSVAKKLAKRIKPDPRTPLKEYTQFEGYTIGKLIGRGSFSLVYQAHEEPSGSEVVIKEYFPKHFSKRLPDDTITPLDGKKLFTFTEGFNQFFNEAMALRKISHPNVLKTHNMFRANRTAYLVSLHKGGRDLKWFLSSVNESMDQALIYQVFMPLLSALHFLHDAELLHLDIKPANILLQPNREPLLLDFGAAQAMTSRKRISRMQTLTHGFAPPEQYDRNRALGPWTDIYAVAATLFYGIACKPPVKSRDSKSKNQLSTAKFGKHYDYELISAVNRALSYTAENRYDNVDDFAKALLAGSQWKSLRDYEVQAMNYDRFELSARQSQSDLAASVA